MKERPILLSAEMVRAVLDGRKTQTRRVIQSPAKSMQANGQKVIDYREPGDKWYGDHVFSMRNQSGTWCDYTKEQFLAKCPFGAVGDRLWVRETWTHESIDAEGGSYSPDYRVMANGQPLDGRWRPSIHMPRWASRITLEITGVRVERLQDISAKDVTDEGIKTLAESMWGPQWWVDAPQAAINDAHLQFSIIWSKIYGEESWQANPWVWVIEFKRVEGEA
ncbi:hypothetical protein [Pantoea ananatis]|uniref:hypothetical protein n=1 Tax=Pantoea ananas TaxID=553 RepID=UPI001B300C64|nr:hypothetical protein [Pantoea ananatis]